MYPRNAASPEPIAIGPVVQISDGAVQTSGCTVRIKPIGVAEGDGAGTTAYSTDGIVLYTPTQAETNYTSFVLIAKKASCIPANITIVTTESATPGRVSLGNVLGTAVTEGAAGRLAGGMVKFFNVASPTGTVNSLPDALYGTNDGLPRHQDVAAILVDTNELQVDWTNGGRLDLLIDAILADTAELQTDWTNGGRLDLLLDATLADTNELQVDWANGGRLDLLLDATLADTNELQTDWANGGRLDLLLDAALADTNELQTDWANGGRLDLLIDAILADTGTDGVVLATATLSKIADRVLRRTAANAEASADGDALSHKTLYGLIQQLQESNTVDTPGVLSIYKVDGVTLLGTITLDTDAAAEPVVGVS